MEREELEKESRKIFHELHKVQGDNAYIFNRLSTLLTTEYLRVKKDFFFDKVCLDAGCGSNANATYNMLRMGAKKVYAFDLDDSIYETASKRLKEFEGKYELCTGNVLKMGYKDKFFDFTHCAGVLHHTYDVFQGLKELARVTKIGGVLFIETYGKGGLVREFVNFLRDKYKCDDSFKFLIDNLKVEDINGFLKWVFLVMSDNGDDYGKKMSLKQIGELFDKDLILTIKDRITAPVYHENSEEELGSWLASHGFVNIERLTRYPKIKNIRRFLCPLYYKYDSKYSLLLYGDGNIQLKAVKAK